MIEHGTFMQDDFKVNDRLTVNAGLRYEIFMPPTEKNNRLANFDYQNYVIVYAGENGTSRSANKKTQYGDLAPRLGLTYKLTSDASTILRTGFGITYFPSPYAAGNLNHLNVPFVISQNVQHETNPLNYMARVRTIADPFPPIVPVKPTTTAELIAANPRVAGHSYENETAYAEQWHLGIDRQLFAALLLEVGYVGSASKHMMLCYNPNEIQPGPGSQNSRRLLQPIASVNNMLQCDPRNRSTFHAGTLKLQKRFSNGYQFLVSYTYGKSLDYGASAASGGGAVGNGQTITDMDAWKGPSGFDTRHRAVISYVYELPFGSGRRLYGRLPARSCRASSAAGSCRGSRRSRPAGRSACRCRPASTTAPRAGPTGLDPASSTTRPSISGSTPPTSSRRRRTPTAMPAAASSTARDT